MDIVETDLYLNICFSTCAGLLEIICSAIFGVRFGVESTTTQPLVVPKKTSNSVLVRILTGKMWYLGPKVKRAQLQWKVKSMQQKQKYFCALLCQKLTSTLPTMHHKKCGLLRVWGVLCLISVYYCVDLSNSTEITFYIFNILFFRSNKTLLEVLRNAVFGKTWYKALCSSWQSCVKSGCVTPPFRLTPTPQC